jgi:hypothetical protein
MDLSKIIAISGKPGLFQLVSSVKNGFVVEGILDKKRFPVYSSSQVSSLEEVSIYTYEEDKPLREVFQNIYEYTQENELVSAKASKNELMSFFEKVLPNYDQDQVYASDVKKVIQWYKILADNNLIDQTTEEAATSEIENNE